MKYVNFSKTNSGVLSAVKVDDRVLIGCKAGSEEKKRLSLVNFLWRQSFKIMNTLPISLKWKGGDVGILKTANALSARGGVVVSDRGASYHRSRPISSHNTLPLCTHCLNSISTAHYVALSFHCLHCSALWFQQSAHLHRAHLQPCYISTSIEKAPSSTGPVPASCSKVWCFKLVQYAQVQYDMILYGIGQCGTAR